MTVFLQWLLCGALSASLVAAALLLLSPALRRRYTARSLYVAWLVVLALFLVPFRVTLWQPIRIDAPSAAVAPWTAEEGAAAAAVRASAAESAPAAQPEPSGITAQTTATEQATEQATERATESTAATQPSDAPVATPRAAIGWAEILACLWLMGAALTLCFHLNRHGQFAQRVRRWRRPVRNEAALSALQAECARLGVKRPVALYRCSLVQSPMLTGYRKPVILLPERAIPIDELALVLRHELTHLRRGDLGMRAALLLATALHWFNPMIYLLARALEEQCEQSCDEAVTRGATRQERLRYGEAILSTARGMSRPDPLLCAHLANGRRSLKRRLTAILNGGGKRPGALVLAGLLALTLVAGSVFGIGASPNALAEEPLAYLCAPEGDSVRVLAIPSMQGWDTPLGIYYNGVEARVVGPQGEFVKIKLGSLDEPYGFFFGYVTADQLSDTPPGGTLPVAAVDAADGGGRAALESESDSADILAMLPDGTQVTLLGRLMDRYHVRVGEQYGLISVADLTLDADTEAFVAAQLPENYAELALGESRVLMQLNSDVAYCVDNYGASPLQWPESERVAYTRRLLQLGYVVDELYAAADGSELPEAQAVELAWEAFLTNTNQGEEIKPDYSVYAALVTERAGDRRTKWRVLFIHKEMESLRYEADVSSPDGAIGATTELADYERWKELLTEHNGIEGVLAEWEQQYGPYAGWSLERKAEYQQTYHPDDTPRYGLPGDNEIGPDEALRLAWAELDSRYTLTQAERDALTPDVRFTLDSTYNGGPANRYEIFFWRDNEDGVPETLYTVYLYSRYGVLEMIEGPENSIG